MQPKNLLPGALFALAGAALLLPLAACSGRSDSAANIYTFTEGAFEVGKTIGDRGLANQVELQNPLSTRVGGRLQVQFDLYNDDDDQEDIEYLVEWFDATGLRISHIENWEHRVIGGSSVETITMVAPRETAVRARLQIRGRTEIR